VCVNEVHLTNRKLATNANKFINADRYVSEYIILFNQLQLLHFRIKNKKP